MTVDKNEQELYDRLPEEMKQFVDPPIDWDKRTKECVSSGYAQWLDCMHKLETLAAKLSGHTDRFDYELAMSHCIRVCCQAYKEAIDELKLKVKDCPGELVEEANDLIDNGIKIGG